jgi:hypothetical protein
MAMDPAESDPGDPPTCPLCGLTSCEHLRAYPDAAPPQSLPTPAQPDPATNDFIRLAAGLYASPAAQRFLERRLELQRTHGAAARTDLSRGTYALARDAYDALNSSLDRLRGRPRRDALDLAARTVDTAGAILLALADAIAAERAALPEEPR